jgi:hypothetical protein
MNVTLAAFALCSLLAQNEKAPYDAGYLCAPAYVLDDDIRGPVRPYVPQPGDIYMSTDRNFFINAGHRLAFSGQPNHSGIVIALPDGTPAILEGGPFNGIKIEILDLFYDLNHHQERTEKCWIRARKTPLTKQQSEELTAWAFAQKDKPFAVRRMLRQMTPFRTRGPLRTYVMGGPHGERGRYFCAELVMETCVHVGALPKETTRPSATYPEDMFFDKSKNYYLNSHFTLADGWHPPARWLARPEAETPNNIKTVKYAPK